MCSPTTCTCSSPGGSSRRAGRNWRRSWKPRGTSGTSPRHRRGDGMTETVAQPGSWVPSGTARFDEAPRLDVRRIREDFPILRRHINGHPLVYLDSANTSQKPRQVLDVLREHYERHNANVARSVHTLGTESTTAYEAARAKVAAFIGAASPDEIVFTKNSTE